MYRYGIKLHKYPSVNYQAFKSHCNSFTKWDKMSNLTTVCEQNKRNKAGRDKALRCYTRENTADTEKKVKQAQQRCWQEELSD